MRARLVTYACRVSQAGCPARGVEPSVIGNAIRHSGMKTHYSPKTRIRGLAIVAVACAVWLAPRFQQFATCRMWQARHSANEVFSHTLGTNHHVSVTDFRRDSVDIVGVNKFGKGPYVVYFPLLPARAVGKPLPQDVRLIVRAVVNDPKQQPAELLKGDVVTGVIRAPGLKFPGQFLNEDTVIKGWIDQPERWHVLDTAPGAYARWTDMNVLLPMGIAMWAGFRMVTLMLLGANSQRALMFSGGALGCVALGLGLEALQLHGPAAWNGLFPIFAALGIAGGAGALPAALAQWYLARSREARNTPVSKELNAELAGAPLEVTQTGFIIRDGQSKKEYLDASVEGFTLDSAILPPVSGIGRKLRTVKLRVTEGKETESFTVTNVVMDGAADELQPFFARIVQSMSRRYGSIVRGTGELKGQSWTLSACGLQVGQGDKKSTYGPRLLNSCEWVHDQFCIWTAEKEEPVLKLHGNDENVHVLAEVFPKLLPQKLLPTKFASGLGRLCTKFQVVSKSGAPLWFFAVAAAFVAASAALGLQPIYLVALAVGLGIVVMLARQDTSQVFSCFDEGLQIQSGSKKRLLKYRDLSKLEWKLSPQGTGPAMLDVAITPETGDPIRFSQKVADAADMPAPLAEMRVRITDGLSTKMLEKLTTTGSVEWTPDVSIEVQGLRVKGDKVYPYADLKDLNADQAKRELTLKALGRAFVISMNAPNYEAGWMVFQLIRQALAEAPPMNTKQTAGAHA